MKKRFSGFTLIEVMTAVAIVAVLAAIAVPPYRDYVMRGQIQEGTTFLSDGRVKMEQFFQDNRTYADVGTSSRLARVQPNISRTVAAPDDDDLQDHRHRKGQPEWIYLHDQSGCRADLEVHLDGRSRAELLDSQERRHMSKWILTDAIQRGVTLSNS